MAQQGTEAMAASPESVYPPSPQWNQPHSACLVYSPLQPENSSSQEQQPSTKGWFLYVLNNIIHVLDPASFKYVGMLVGPHTNKINALAARQPDQVRQTGSSEADNGSVEALLRHGLSPASSSSSFPASPMLPQEHFIAEDQRIVSSSSQEMRTIVASAGDDRVVVCWDVVGRRPIFSLPNAHETEIKAVEWMYNGTTVVSGDRSGCITIWDPYSVKHVKRAPMDKAPIACIKACPSPGQDSIAAIGYETGDILICQLRLADTILLQRLHGHTGRIHSLSWQPYHGQDVGDDTKASTMRNDEPAFAYLASGSADQTIRIWDVDKTRTKILAKIPGLGGKQGQQQNRVKAWVPVEWTPDGRMFMSFTSRGGCVMWKVDGTPDKVYKILHGCQHIRMVYQVLVWRTGEFAFSFGMDRRIIVWDLKRQEGIVQVDGLAGPIDAIDVSHLDPGRLAIANGNNSITLWNTMSHDIPYESIVIDRLTSRVRCLAWHPSEEGTIAFGLDNGKIGMIDRVYEWNPQQSLLRPGKYKDKKKGQSSQGPLPLFFPSYHGSGVLSVQWCSPKTFSAPIPELLDLCLEERSSCLVTCGDDGRVLVTVVSKASASKASLDLDTVLTRQNPAWYEELRLRTGWTRLQRRGVAIHPNEDLMAIGNADGSLEIIELRHFRVVHVYHGHKSRLDQIAWCRVGGEEVGNSADDQRETTARYLLACGGGDDAFVSVLHLDQYAPKSHADQATVLSAMSSGSTHSIVPSLECMQTFHCHPAKGKRRGCSSLEWCPFPSVDGVPTYRFASSSYDGSVAVCEVTLPTALQDSSADLSSNTMTLATAPSKKMTCPAARFVAHHQITNAVRWSLTDEHLLYTGGSDWRVCIWDWRKYRISEETFKELAQRSQFGGSQEASSTTGSIHGRKRQQQTDKLGKRGAGKTQGAAAASDVSSITETTSNKRQLPTQAGMTDEAEEAGWSSEAPPSKKHASHTRELSSALALESGGEGGSPSGVSYKMANLFPRSSAAFRTESRRRSLLEIIRLTRNLYSQPKREDPSTMDANRWQRQRWKAMLRFFEADGEPEGQVLAAILRKDVHELNIDDFGDSDEDEDIHKDQETDARRATSETNGESKSKLDTKSTSREGSASLASVVSSGQDKSSVADIVLELPQEGEGDVGRVNHSNASAAESPMGFKADDVTDEDTYGDTIFYGSREAIISLAQMESQALASLDAEGGRSIFQPGAGMGVVYSRMPVSTRRGIQGDKSTTKPSEDIVATTRSSNGPQASHRAQSTSSAQLSRIPISYWLGDVPDMMAILSSTAALGVHDWIGLALSPMGGVTAWRGMMAQMASKCLAQGEVHAAVLCFLGIGQVREAVEAYRANGMFREALMLLKIRMWDDDQDDGGTDSQENADHDEPRETDDGAAQCSLPTGAELQASILAEWGRVHERRGEYEQAAKCQLALGSLLVSPRVKLRKQGAEDAVTPETMLSNSTIAGLRSVALAGSGWSMGLQTLSRRGDIATLRAVAGLAILLDDRFQQSRIQHYNSTIAAKRLADESRRLAREKEKEKEEALQ